MRARPSALKAKLRRRLSGYWRLELANAFLLPAAIVFLAYGSGSQLGWLAWLCFLPMSGMLVIGGLYWRGKLDAMEGRPARLLSALALADRFETPLGTFSVAALTGALASWLIPALSVSQADRMAATASAVLAVLEFINYYHRQLQHFDHKADFKRLVINKGFRKSQMAVDLARFRTHSL